MTSLNSVCWDLLDLMTKQVFIPCTFMEPSLNTG